MFCSNLSSVLTDSTIRNMKKTWIPKQTGFTIVELVTVITVIGILEAITIVAYTNIQEGARDSARLTDAKSIVKALEIHKSRMGSYPEEGTSGWEMSSSTNTFMSALVDANVMSEVPVDPINSGGTYYRYHLYPAGSGGCDASRGPFYVFMVMDLEATSDRNNGSGFTCASRDWNLEADWVAGNYTY